MSDEALMMVAILVLQGGAWLCIGLVVGRWLWGQ
jgi:hypothetical protein